MLIAHPIVDQRPAMLSGSELFVTSPRLSQRAFASASDLIGDLGREVDGLAQEKGHVRS